MVTPMIGDWTVKVLEVRPFAIHGDLYYELKVTQESSPDQITIVRVPQHAVEGMPTPGQLLTLSFLMGQVVSAKPEKGAERPESAS